MREPNATLARALNPTAPTRKWAGSELEQLEQRQMMTASTLPLSLTFSSAVSHTVVDRTGKGTGFSAAQAGSSSSVALNTAASTLALTADSSASKPVMALETAFDGSTRGFTITARLIGPLSNLAHTSDQAGIFLGTDPYNTIKLVALRTATGETLQFQGIVGGKIIGADSASYIKLGSTFASIKTLDVRLTGDSVTGSASAHYSINGKGWQAVSFSVTVPAASRTAFFNTSSKAGLLVSDRHGPITATFDSFAIAAGTPLTVSSLPSTLPPPPVVTAPIAVISRNAMAFSDLATSSAPSAAQTVRITNTGTADLIVSAATFSGDNASEFNLTSPITAPITIAAGQRYDFYVTFTTSSTNSLRDAQLAFTTNASAAASPIKLRGLGLGGQGGAFEPSLQRIIDLYQIPISTGESDTNDNSFPVDTATANSADEVAMQQLVAASSSPVTIELLGVFANQVSATTIGWYEAGNPQTTYKLGSIAAANAQSISPLDAGMISFGPGTNSFGLYGNFTLGSANKPLNRNVYSESSLNTWETNTSRQKKVRFYQLRDSSGNVVPNAYVFAFEEYNVTFDQNDIVGIIRNVKPAAAGPEIGLENLDGVPAADQLVMSRVQHTNPDLPSQSYHDTSVVRVHNTGALPMNISGMVLSNTDFTIVSGGGPQTVAAGGYVDVTVKFVYSDTASLGNKLRTATLIISSDDADEPTKTVKLSGIWQSYSENQPNGVSAEPTAETVIQAYGYSTAISTSSAPINTKGVNKASGDEVLSQLWQRSDTGLPVTVRMLATYHQVYDVQWNTHSTLYTYDPNVIDSATGKPLVTKLLSHEQQYSQSVLPTIDGSMTDPAQASWIPTSSTFGFNIDGQKNGTFSQDIYNTPNDASNPGHGWRFYVAKDAKGNIIPDTYLACQDYVKVAWANYDYQDNILLITNVKPLQAPQVVAGVAAATSAGATKVTWKANSANDITGYNVYRALSTAGTFTKLTDTPVNGISFTDTTTTAGTNYYYYVTAAAYQGGESAPSLIVSATAGTGTAVTVPTAASAVVATATSATSVSVTWMDNSTSETGFRIERSIAGGSYTAIGTTAANASSFVDATASASTVYSYRVYAVNSAGDSPASNVATVTTPAATAPTPPVAGSLVSTDIGNPTPAGHVNTVTAGKDYDAAVGGVDIWGTYDSFNFVYGQKTGDFDVAVHVTGLTNIDPSTMAGLMARDSLASGARNVNVKIRPSGYRLSYRYDTNGQTSATGSGSGSLNNAYVRLQRAGNVFNSYVSSDGVTWTLLGSVSMTMGSTVYLGMATCGKSSTTAATANYRNYGNTSDMPAGTATPTPPVLPVTPPVNTSATTIAASADAYVYDGASSTNYGSATSLTIKKGSTGYNRQTLITFDISQVKSLTNAKLRLYTSLNTSDSVQMAVFGATTSLAEGATTWANKPATSASVLATAVVNSTTARWTEIDLTSYIQQALAAGKTSVTLSLQGTASSTAYISVASRESGVNGPQLVVQ